MNEQTTWAGTAQPAELAAGSKWEEQGTTGIPTFAGFIKAAYDSKLTWPSCQPLYSRIWRSDPEIAIVRHVFDALAGQVEVGWELPEHVAGKDLDAPTDDDKQALEFAWSVTEDIEDGIGEFLNTCVTHVPFFGWGWWEAVPGLRKAGWAPPGDDPWRSQYDDGRVGYRRLAWRDYSSFFAWDIDDRTGQLYGMEQLAIPNPVVKIPLDKSLHITFGDRSNPEGLATLEALWRLERIKYGLEVVQGIGYEHAAGHAMFTAEGNLSDADKSELRTAARAILTAQEGNYLALPSKIKGEIIDVPFSAAGNILEAIKYYGILKLSLFGMQWVALSATTGAGSYAAMDDSSSMMLTLFNAMCKGFIDQSDRQIGKRLFDYNADAFPGMTRRPRLVLRHGVEKRLALPELSSFATAINAIMPLTPEDLAVIREKSGFLPPAIQSTEEEPEPEEPEVDSAESEAEDQMDSEGAPDDQEESAGTQQADEGAELAEQDPKNKAPQVTKDGVMVMFSLAGFDKRSLNQAIGKLPRNSSRIESRDMHITLAFLGRVADQKKTDQDLYQAVINFANSEAPIHGIYQKVDRFHNPDSEYGDAIYAVFESDNDSILDFQARLVDALSKAGFDVSKKHDFVAHTTLAYIPSGAKFDLPEIEELDIEFSSISAVWGKSVMSAILQGKRKAELARGIGGMSYQQMQDGYANDIYAAMNDYLFNGQSVTKFRNAFKRAVLEYFDGAFHIGYLEGGGVIGEMTEEDRAWLVARQNAEVGYVDILFQDLKAARAQAAETGANLADLAFKKSESYAKTLGAIYSEGKARGAGNMMLRLEGPDGFESCETCQKYKGQWHTAKWWVENGLVPGPGNHNYECGGYNCQHRLFDREGKQFAP